MYPPVEKLLEEHVSTLCSQVPPLVKTTLLHIIFVFIFTWCVQILRSPKEAFATAIQSWRERCEKCVCLQGDYFEE